MRTLITILVSVLVSVGAMLGIAHATGAWDQPERQAPSAVIQPNNADVDVETDAGPTSPHDIYQRASPGVVFITTRVVSDEGLFGGPRESTGQGSGFVIDDQGYIMTNEHVVEGAQSVTVQFGKQSVAATVVGADPSTDLALLKVNPDKVKLTPLALGDSSSVKIGDPALAIGNPYGLARTLTTGVISALGRPIESPNGFRIDDALQTDAAINPGNSGGPLLDGNGRVIGINSQILTGGSGSNGNVGIGFAVPIDLAKSLVGKLKQGDVERAYLGLSGLTIDKSVADTDDSLPRAGVLTVSVTPGSPAAAAGIRGGTRQVAGADGAPVVLGGDVILSIDGKRTDSMDRIVKIVQSLDVGARIRIVYSRGGQKRLATVTLAQRPTDNPLQRGG